MSIDRAVPTISSYAAKYRFLTVIFTVVLTSSALYFGRVVLEPIAFVLFAIALVEPLQKAAERRFGKGLAITITIILTLVVLSLLVGAIVWSVSDIVHWGFANLERFQSLYKRTTQWLQEHDLFVVDLESLGSFSFPGCSKPLRDMLTTLSGLRLSSFYSWRLV